MAQAAVTGVSGPSTAALAPFLTDDDGNLTSAFENAGIVNVSPTTATKRELSATLPWTSPLTTPQRKLTHFRAPGMGDPMWSGECVYDLAGGSPSYSWYDHPDVDAKDDGLSEQVRAGVGRNRQLLPPGEPTFTRRTRVAAAQDSAPAAQFFQGYWNPHWSGLMAGFVKTPVPSLHVNFNPTQQGTKELHKATQYNPVPPMGSLTGYYGSNDKAL